MSMGWPFSDIKWIGRRKVWMARVLQDDIAIDGCLYAEAFSCIQRDSTRLKKKNFLRPS